MLQSRPFLFFPTLAALTVFHHGNSDACISIEVNSIIVLLDEPTLDPRRAFLYKPAARGSSRRRRIHFDPPLLLLASDATCVFDAVDHCGYYISIAFNSFSCFSRRIIASKKKRKREPSLNGDLT